jgi:hypothetical protein
LTKHLSGIWMQELAKAFIFTMRVEYSPMSTKRTGNWSITTLYCSVFRVQSNTSFLWLSETNKQSLAWRSNCIWTSHSKPMKIMPTAEYNCSRRCAHFCPFVHMCSDRARERAQPLQSHKQKAPHHKV